MRREQGTRQGSLTLFKVYINDIHEIFNKSQCDPVVIYINEQPIGCLTFADDFACCAKYKRTWLRPSFINKI